MNGNLVNNFFLRAKAMTNINMEKCESEKEKVQPTLRLLSSAKTIRHILFSPCMHEKHGATLASGWQLRLALI